MAAHLRPPPKPRRAFRCPVGQLTRAGVLGPGAGGLVADNLEVTADQLGHLHGQGQLRGPLLGLVPTLAFREGERLEVDDVTDQCAPDHPNTGDLCRIPVRTATENFGEDAHAEPVVDLTERGRPLAPLARGDQ